MALVLNNGCFGKKLIDILELFKIDKKCQTGKLLDYIQVNLSYLKYFHLLGHCHQSQRIEIRY